MADMMKKMGKMGKKGLMRQMGGLFGKGGMPAGADPAALQKAAQQMGRQRSRAGCPALAAPCRPASRGWGRRSEARPRPPTAGAGSRGASRPAQPARP